MYTIPLQNVPAQTFNIVLDGQYCTLSVYKRGDALYMDLYVEDSAVFTGAICVNMSVVNQFMTADFDGVFIFRDQLGDSEPEYDDLEDRYILYYFTADEWEEFTEEEKHVVC